MGLFSQPNDKKELIAAFYIGSSKVAGALFYPKNSGPKIIFSVVEPIDIEDELDTDRFLSRTLASLGVVADKMHRSGLGAPKRAFFVLSSPWYASQTRTISFKKNNPFVFTEKIADDLIQKEIKVFSEEHLTRYSEEQNAVRTIELKNIRTLLNGYEVAEPLFKKTQDIEMTIFISMSGEEVLAKIENTIGKYFNFEQIKFSSFAMASFTVVRDMDFARENFLLLDIGGEVTEIFMVKKNIMRESRSFPLWRNFFIRGVAAELGVSLSESDSLLSLWKDGHAALATEKKLSEAMGKLRTEWLRKFQESLANLSGDISIPASVYIASDIGFTGLFSDMVKAEQFSQYTLTESKFDITPLDTKLLHSLARFEDPAVRDAFIIISSVYINRFLLNQ